LMAHRSIGPSMVVSGLLGMAIFSVDTYVPLYVQGGRGGTAASAAAVVTPVMLAMSVAALIAAPLMIRWGFRKLVTIGSVLVALGFLGMLISAVAVAPLWLLTGLLFFTGLGFAPCSMGTLLGAQDAVEYQQRGIVTSGVTFFRNFGGALGVGLFGALFNLLTVRGLGNLTGGHFSAGDLLDPAKLKTIRATHPELLERAQATIRTGLLWVFGGMLVLALVMVVISRMISAKKHEGKVSLSEVMEAVA
jgi:MFS family permease